MSPMRDLEVLMAVTCTHALSRDRDKTKPNDDDPPSGIAQGRRGVILILFPRRHAYRHRYDARNSRAELRRPQKAHYELKRRLQRRGRDAGEEV
jgi:hypothetical protein